MGQTFEFAAVLKVSLAELYRELRNVSLQGKGSFRSRCATGGPAFRLTA